MATTTGSSSSFVARDPSATFVESSPRSSFVGGQSVVITRTASSTTSGSRGGGGGGGGQRSALTRGPPVGPSFQPIEAGQYVTLTTTGVNSMKDSREREKKDMQDLNSRFADYLDRVRFLETRNRDLAEELEKLKTKWGKETAQIKAMFQAELDEARNNLDDALKEKARLEIRSTSIEEELELVGLEYSAYLQIIAGNAETFRFQIEQIANYEREIQILRRNIAALEQEKLKNRELISKLEESLANARDSLNEETLGHIDAANRCQTIEEEIEFLKRVHEQEMKELRGLIDGGSEAESRDYWKKEMEQAIREIAQMYEDKMTTIKDEMEISCRARVNEAKERQEKEEEESSKTTEESAQMKNDLADLRDVLSRLMNQNEGLVREHASLCRLKEAKERELETTNMQLQSEAASVRRDLDALLLQLQLLMNTKASLELEIAAYRKLLDGEEKRLDSKLNMNSESMSLLRSEKTESDDIYSSSSGELRAKTTFQTTAKGALAISDCSPDGYRVTVENKGKKVESLVGWKINRVVDGKLENQFVFDEKYQRIDPGKKVNVWANGKKPRIGGFSLDAELTTETWGVGTRVITKLLNPEEEERATHNQQTVYVR